MKRLLSPLGNEDPLPQPQVITAIKEAVQTADIERYELLKAEVRFWFGKSEGLKYFFNLVRRAIPAPPPQLLWRRGEVCYLCGFEIKERDHCVDHVIPIPHRGCLDPDNLKPVHRGCNSVKRNQGDTPDLRAWCRSSYLSAQARKEGR